MIYIRSLLALIFNYDKPVLALDEKYWTSLMVCIKRCGFG